MCAAEIIRLITVPCNESDIVCQKPFDFRCGYAAIINALHCGPPQHKLRVRNIGIEQLIDTYGSKRSKTYGEKLRHSDTGIKGEDLRDIYNDLRQAHGLSEMSGQYLSRHYYEMSNQTFLRRIYNLIAASLSGGEPVIVLLSSQSAQQEDSSEKHVWQSLISHYITVVGVSEPIGSDASFIVIYADPLHASLNQMLVYSDARNFVAFKGAKSEGRWVRNRPFPVVTGGQILLETENEPWYRRTLVYMHYAIHQK